MSQQMSSMRRKMATQWCVIGALLAACGGKASPSRHLDQPDQGGANAGSDSGTDFGRTSTGGATATTQTPPPLDADCADLIDQGGLDPEYVCSITRLELDNKRASVLFLVDASSSMNTVPEGYSKTKWSSAIDAIRFSLDPTDPYFSYGVLTFPHLASSAATSCELETGVAAIRVPVGPAAETVPRINQVMADTVPVGGTPTAKALDAALAYYNSGPGIRLDGDKTVVLVTDGGPNCNPDLVCATETCTAFMDKSPNLSPCWDGSIANCCQPALDVASGISPWLLCLDDASVTGKIDALNAVGVRTFVVGLPGSEPYAPYLDAFAEAGGTATFGQRNHYYAVTSDVGLFDTIRAIIASLEDRCILPLDERPLDKNALYPAVDCIPLPQKTGDQVNWSYDEATQAIVIEGPKCEEIRSQGVQRIDMINVCGGSFVE